MTDEQQRSRQGVIFAVSAYTMWGIAPIYFKALEQVPALEILSHRVIWSFVFLAILLQAGRHWHSVVSVFKRPKTFGLLAVTGLLVGINWLIFIWAVNADHMLDASLGYYINPLLNVLLGMMFLGERLRKLQWLAVFLAAIGVLVQLVVFGSVPIVAIALAFSFGFYGLLRKKINMDAQTGLFIETLVMLPAAAIYVFFIANSATSDMSTNSLSLNLLLFAAGIVTTLPLLCFTGAATRIKLSTLGFFQYIGPSLMFLLAVLVYGEAFTLDKAVTFGFIWGALLVFSVDGIRNSKKSR
ncbi:putative Permease of the drug/metabolite transporter (DMT) superfamily RarD [Vibrio nigripulchritudo MADA3029]|uniref:Putative Permease of the drug/metabolite transporter (DMT) superfamily RarD n=1 Tax=Vibrio nigripulchritudo TaxID=28173 RepID=U4K3E1_9VIBR|nr:EamA family transporter RarD [Vibrio nigripulchritudo]KJY69575.1 chloramphenical resistance permease RarD [Vibrio nigripulchritudo]CCN38095.1 putative Permease of the drug/metabolite transporter (DMT) superfamily RarD [Vibrio nigripulchritudo AM115]CCN43974.1 putative Permease of the drug/metabolite transporter (DMT) superfamily RarD [Vibrio nigripulchritudo FTn2]CCN49984.1 putative Permease of the drug/metabolite transporter (DMT) superfamily RarD [Vibrio nigripulchritudo MADA3020]CCN53168